MIVFKSSIIALAVAGTFTLVSAAASAQPVTSHAPSMRSQQVSLAARGNDCNNNGIPDNVDVSGTEWAELLASDAALSDFFGTSVSLSGDVAVIGASGDDDPSGSGAAYVFRFSGTTWVEEARLTASDAASNDSFGSAVSVSGDVAVIGARREDGVGTDLGSAYVFGYVGGAWVQQAKLTASDAADFDRFGVSVAVSGDLIVIGCWENDDAGSSSGSAYVYQKPATGWVNMTETAKLTASDAAQNDRFGFAVSVAGDWAMIGAPIEGDAGSVYAFEKPPSGWVNATETAKLIALDGAGGDSFGGAISGSGARVVIGAVADDDAGDDSGSAYVFGYNGSTWVEHAKLIASDGVFHGFFGSGVSVSGDLALIGAWGHADAGFDSGSAYLFERNTGGADNWGQIAKLNASDAASNDAFGRVVSISGDRAVIGAHSHGHTAGDAGSAYVFSVGSIDCNANGVPDECDIASGFSSDCQFNGIPDKCELGACCLLPDDCADEQTEAVCLAAGGLFRGPCRVCPTQSVDIIPEPGGDVFVHSIGPPAGCPPPASSLRRIECPEFPSVFIDPWVSPEDETGQTMCHSFGVTGSPPIPADFFGPGSDPFTGVACLRGVPLGATPWGEFGEADTLIERSQDPFDRCELPSPGSQVNVSIEVVALSLESVDPITVTYNGGQDPEEWGATVDLSAITPPPGSLTAIKSHCSGGTYTSVLNVQPRFTFAKVSDPAELRVLDTGLSGIQPVQLVQSASAPWVSIPDPELGVAGDPCSDFHAGLTETNPPADCDCNSNLVHDVCDTDCNGNSTPDACDPPGDFLADADIDMDDFASFAVCFTGDCAVPPCDPPLYIDECCAIADFDGDGDVDLDDLADFVLGLIGPQ